MKYLFVLSTVLAGFLVAFSACAEKVPMVDSQGNISLVESPGRELSFQEQAAYQSPGKEVGFGKLDTFYKRVDYFHLQKWISCPQVAVYDGKQLKVLDKPFTAAIGERFFAFHLIILLAIVLSMVGSNYCMATAKDGRKFTISFILMCAVALSMFLLFLLTTAMNSSANFKSSMCLIFAWVIFAFMPSSLDKSKKAYWIASALFYVSALIVFLPC